MAKVTHTTLVTLTNSGGDVELFTFPMGTDREVALRRVSQYMLREAKAANPDREVTMMDVMGQWKAKYTMMGTITNLD